MGGAADARRVILLRGVNVGQRRLAMAALRAGLEQAGFCGVRTLLQSGNVVIDAGGAAAGLAEADLVVLCERVIGEIAGFTVPVVVRDAGGLEEVVAADPLGAVADDPKRYLVSFCASEVGGQAAELLAEACGDGEQVAVVGREIYSWHPEGVGRSPLWERVAKLGGGRDGRGGRTALPVATARNWRTVTALLELARAD